MKTISCQNFTIPVDQTLQCIGGMWRQNTSHCLFILGFCGEWFHAMTELLHLSSLREKWRIPGSLTSPSNMYKISWPEMLRRSMTTGLGTTLTNFQHNSTHSMFICLVCRKGGYVYICGKISMAEGVENALKDVLKHIGMMDAETAEKTFDDMRRNSRYQEDIFGWTLS